MPFAKLYYRSRAHGKRRKKNKVDTEGNQRLAWEKRLAWLPTFVKEHLHRKEKEESLANDESLDSNGDKSLPLPSEAKHAVVRWCRVITQAHVFENLVLFVIELILAIRQRLHLAL